MKRLGTPGHHHSNSHNGRWHDMMARRSRWRRIHYYSTKRLITMFFFGSTSVSSHLLQRSYGPCMRCNGSVNLIEESRQFYAFCCLPFSPTSEKMVVCPQCGMRIRASYYYPSKNTPYQVSTLDDKESQQEKEDSFPTAPFQKDKHETQPLIVEGQEIP